MAQSIRLGILGMQVRGRFRGTPAQFGDVSLAGLEVLVVDRGVLVATANASGP